MSLTTTSEISAPVNVIFQVNLLRNAKPLCPYYTGTVPAEIAENRGTFTAKWRRIENLTPTTTALSELTGAIAFPTRAAIQPSITDLTATVAKYGQYILLNEEVDLINFNSQSAKLSEILGINAGRSLNRLQRNVMEDNLTSIFTGGATTATAVSAAAALAATVRLTSIANAVNALDRNDAMKFRPQTEGSRNIGTAPVRESYWGINHPDTTADVRGLTGFNAVETYAGQTETAPGEYGHVGGVRFLETSEATIDAGTGATVTASATTEGRAATGNRTDVYNTVIFGMDAVGSLGLGGEHVKETYRAGDRLPAVQVIAHQRGSAGAGDPLNEISTIGWKSWHAGLVLNSAWGRVIKHTASRLEAL